MSVQLRTSAEFIPYTSWKYWACTLVNMEYTAARPKVAMISAHTGLELRMSRQGTLLSCADMTQMSVTSGQYWEVSKCSVFIIVFIHIRFVRVLMFTILAMCVELFFRPDPCSRSKRSSLDKSGCRSGESCAKQNQRMHHKSPARAEMIDLNVNILQHIVNVKRF